MKKAVFRAPSDEDPIEANWEEDPNEVEEMKIYIGKVRRLACPSPTADPSFSLPG